MKQSSLNKAAIVVMLAAIMFIVFLYNLSGGAFSVSAASAYSNVLTDLMQDENFNTADYPVNNSDYSLSVIQIAESDENEIFIYVYQPCIAFSQMIATSLNMSLTENVKDTHNYKLTLLNRGGALGKYKVNGVTVGNDNRRIYNITSIFRSFNKLIDETPGYDNTISEVAYPVGQIWAAVTTADSVVYSMTESEVIVVTDKFVGSLHYEGGVPWYGGTETCDSHFVAFSTDREIERLISAKVSFVTQTWSKATSVSETKYGEKIPQEKTITYTDVASPTVNGIIKRKYSWDRIQRASEFVENKDIPDDIKKEIKNKKWVLNFYETKSESGAGVTEWAVSWLWGLLTQWSGSGTFVSDVTILQLEYETDGEYYNIGVVDNKQTGSKVPINQSAIDKKHKRNWLIFGLVVAGIVVIALIVLSIVYPVVGKVVIKICKGLWFVICLPFRGIAALVKRVQGRKRATAATSAKKKKNNNKSKAKGKK